MSSPESPPVVGAAAQGGAGASRKMAEGGGSSKSNGHHGAASRKASTASNSNNERAAEGGPSTPPPPPPHAMASTSAPTSIHPAASVITTSQDGDLFSFLSNMHLSGGAAGGAGGGGGGSGNVVAAAAAAAAASGATPNQIASRKRKFLEQAGSFSGKLTTGGMRPPYFRRGSDDDDQAPAVAAAISAAAAAAAAAEHHSLQTPQCSQSGYADEEDRHHSVAEAAAAAAAIAAAANERSGGGRTGGSHPHAAILPVEIEDENLAANFDDSLSGLGVDINTSTYSMSEALLALPNLSISSSHIFKQEGAASVSPSRMQQQQSHPHLHQDSPPRATHSFKDEPRSNSNSNSAANNNSSSRQQMNYGALDLSNDEAHLPDNVTLNNSDEGAPKTFTGSVSRESSRGGTPQAAAAAAVMAKSFVAETAEPEKSKSGKSGREDRRSSSGGRSHKVILQTMGPPSTTTSLTKPSASSSTAASSSSATTVQVAKVERFERLNETATVDEANRFQYILVAPTSLATKREEASITYLNQGQSYEVRLKKLGDLSGLGDRRLKCTMRICFHERRLQYMEAEQIGEWRNAHPGERILDIDLPLSYGVAEPLQDPKHLNAVSFKWDPTRETGIFIKVNCISTEFTPKKHGGERGVPFRLQLETFEPVEGVRLHAAGCVLQVFKLKGADRKHKQDREKIAKRPAEEQEKYSPSYDCTVLTDLNVDSIYVPPASRTTTTGPTASSSGGTTAGDTSRSGTPQVGDGGGGGGSGDDGGRSVASRSASPASHQRQHSASRSSAEAASNYYGLKSNVLGQSTSADGVQQWLKANRYGAYAAAFRNFCGRDMLRLMREETINLCGLADGIRIFNDLHVVAVAPRNTLYLAHKDNTREYSAIFLDEPTVADFLLKLSSAFGLEPSCFSKVFLVGPHGILIRVNDDVIAYTKPETIFQFSIRPSAESGVNGSAAIAAALGDGVDGICDVILENVSPLLEAAESLQQQQQQQQQPPPPHHQHAHHPQD